MGRRLIAHLDAKNQVAPESSPYAQRLQSLCAAHTDEDGEKLNFRVYLSEIANAFACPDGSIRVYSHLMDMLNDDELLGVIGHEIGHITGNHTLEKMRTAYLLRAGKKIAGKAILKTFGDGATLTLSTAVLTWLAERYLNAQYSQHEELEADDYGLKFMLRHSYNAAAMPSAFRKLAELGHSRIQAFSSHPDPLTRAERLAKTLKERGQ